MILHVLKDVIEALQTNEKLAIKGEEIAELLEGKSTAGRDSSGVRRSMVKWTRTRWITCSAILHTGVDCGKYDCAGCLTRSK